MPYYHRLLSDNVLSFRSFFNNLFLEKFFEEGWARLGAFSFRHGSHLGLGGYRVQGLVPPQQDNLSLALSVAVLLLKGLF